MGTKDQISWLGLNLLVRSSQPLLAASDLWGDASLVGEGNRGRSSPLQSRDGGSFALLFPEIFSVKNGGAFHRICWLKGVS